MASIYFNGQPIKIQLAATDAIRTEMFNGREHIVVPAIAIVEGVLESASSSGPVLNLAEEFGKTPGAWNGRPITLGHPERNGVNVSASKTPEIFIKEGVGFIFNTLVERTDESSRLKMEFFLDTEKMPKDEMKRLQSGETLEVSTGFFADFVPFAGEFEGKAFDGVNINVVPDHIAILPEGQIGASSVADGAGTPRINNGKPEEVFETLVRSSARRPTFTGTETTPWSGPTLQDFKAAFDGSTDFTSVEDAPAAFKRFAASHSLLGEADAVDLRNLVFFPVVRPSTGKLNANALRAVLGGRGAQADIPESARESARSVARSLLEKEFDQEMEVMNTEEKTVDIENEPNNTHANDEKISSLARKVAEFLGLTRKNEGISMETKIKELIACENAPFTEDDMEMLTAWKEERIESLLAAYAEEGTKDITNDVVDPEVAVNASEVDGSANILITATQKVLLDRIEAEDATSRSVIANTLFKMDNCPLSLEVLQAKDLKELESLEKWVTPETEAMDFSGNAAPQTPGDAGPKVVAMGRIYKIKQVGEA